MANKFKKDSLKKETYSRGFSSPQKRVTCFPSRNKYSSTIVSEIKSCTDPILSSRLPSSKEGSPPDVRDRYFKGFNKKIVYEAFSYVYKDIQDPLSQEEFTDSLIGILDNTASVKEAVNFIGFCLDYYHLDMLYLARSKS